MTIDPTRPAHRRPRATIALAALALCASLAPGSAAAAPGSGEATLSLKPGSQSSLLRQGVKVTYSAKAGKTGATKRLARKGKGGATQTVAIAIDDVVLGPPAVLGSPGVLTFSKGGAKTSLTDIEVRFGAKGATVSGELGGKRIAVFRAAGEATIDSSSVKLEKAKLSLTGKVAGELRDRFDNDRISGGRIGSAKVGAAVTPAAPKPADPAKKIDDGGLKPASDPFAAQCPVASSGGSPLFGQAPTDGGPLAAGPSLSNPLALAAGNADWGFKTSFRNYVLGTQEPGSAGTITALDGASDIGGGNFRFSGTGEYVRQRTATNDQLVLDGQGSLLFCKKAHSFHVALDDPTVILDGANSRIVASAGLNRSGAWGGFRRTDFASLDLTGLRPTYSADGKTATWSSVPAKLTTGGAAVTGLYPAGTPLDPITVSASVDTVPDLYADTCAIPSAASETALELPEAPVASPAVTGTALAGGNVRWGIHAPLRNNTLAPNPTAGSLQTFEGASYDSGNAVFEYPETSGTYAEGVPANPADDRLVLHAKGIALLCKPAHLHRYALSNPTVIIDGLDSRLVVDMDLRVKGLVRPSVRSDFATLDLSSVVPTVNGNTITWANIPTTLTQNGSEAFNGRYPAGTLIDPITVSATLP